MESQAPATRPSETTARPPAPFNVNGRLRAFVLVLSSTLPLAACAHHNTATEVPPFRLSSALAGIWSGFQKETIAEGVAAGDTHIAKQEWHLAQTGQRVSGYYVEAETFVSGDGRPYVCNRQPQFSTITRFEVSGVVDGDGMSAQLAEVKVASPLDDTTACAPRRRNLRQYHARVTGDLLVIANDSVREMLYRSLEGGLVETTVIPTTAARPVPAVGQSAPKTLDSRGPALAEPRGAAADPDADISGIWIWEHRAASPEGDEKIEREEWHVEQEGADLRGYYDRIVHQISTDGHAYRCSMALDFRLVTRYQFVGQVRDSKIAITEKSFEVLAPNACDNGKRRLDAYEGAASPDELRLIWERGAQILRRPRPDVPTQRF